MRTGETETAQEPPPICAHAEAFLDMLRSEEAAEAIGPAMQCCYTMTPGRATRFTTRSESLLRCGTKFEISRGHRARVCGLWSSHCMFLAIWTQ